MIAAYRCLSLHKFLRSFEEEWTEVFRAFNLYRQSFVRIFF